MAKERTLNIPTHDVIDVTVVTDHGGPTNTGEPPTETVNPSSTSQARDERVEHAQPGRAQTATWGLDPLAHLRYEAYRSGQDLMSAMRRSGITAPGVVRQEQRRKMTTLQQAYASQMIFHAMTPLRRGISAQGILEAVGMSTMMLLVSPQFRDQVGLKTGEVYSAITNKIARRGEKRTRGREQAVLLNGGSRNDMNQRDIRRLERYDKLDRHGLAPLTAESAALMEVGIAEDAYAQMRAPGADPEFVMSQHSSALNELYSMAIADGVDVAQISTNMRTIVAVRMTAEPRLAQVFSELSHGRFTPDGRGQLRDPSTGKYVNAGSFKPRAPMDEAAHGKALHRVFARDLDTALSAGEKPMEAQMYVLAAGMFTQQYPDVVEAVDDPELRERLSTCRSIFASMADDGLSPEQTREAYQKALVGAIDATSAKSEEFAQRWSGPEGDQWRARLAEQLDEFSKFAKSTHEEYVNVVDEGVVHSEPSHSGEPAAPPETSSVQFPDPGMFTPPRYTNYEQPEADLVEQMSTFMGDDLIATSRIDDGRDMAGHTWMPRSVYSTPPSQESERDSSIYSADPHAHQRELEMLSMRKEMVRLGLPTAQQDRMFAAAYVRGLEKTVEAQPAYELIVERSRRAGVSSWQQMEFARALARTHTSQPQEGYYGFLARIGADTEVQHKVSDVDSVKSNQSRSRREAVSETMPAAYGQELVRARELDQRRRQIRRVRGRLNRAYNAEDDHNVGVEPDVQFDFTDKH